ncbi:hypothetical protein Hypma_005709 [Hypsizygus marmoreus]|uniref:Uncharacterized protein n=1 Tax=Hypsizygus marmoreus TaxID=39966 RepID=A0A369K7J7_HYPMA|nr:hypothetical protein Hypma_005709 [Hypsizygus marmoreus]
MSSYSFPLASVSKLNGISGTATKPRSDARDWEKKAQEELTIIGLTIALNQYGHIRNVKNGVEAWKALKNVYEKNFYVHDKNGSIQKYISGITALTSRLITIRVKLDNEDITNVLIFNLHESYSSIAASLTAAKGKITIADVTGTLLEEEAQCGR